MINSLRAPGWTFGLCLLLGAMAFAPKPATSQETLTISGVTTTEDGQPLEYTVVGLPELRIFALSGADGSFTLEGVTPGVYRFVALKRGYYYADAFVELSESGEIEVVLDVEDPNQPVERGRLVGQFLDQQSGDPLRDVELTLQPMGLTTTTDRQGRFSFDELTIGALLLESERMGYSGRADTLAAAPGVTLSVTVFMQPEAVELEPIVVEVTALNAYLENNGFYRRENRGLGQQITREDIERRNPVYLTDMFNAVPGIRKGRDNFGQVVLQSTRDGCALTTWLDGMRVPGFDMDTYPPDAVEAIELYRGPQVPPEYRDPCGVVLIWSRR